jgi:small-conductance mechanosensitive channel
MNQFEFLQGDLLKYLATAAGLREVAVLVLGLVAGWLLGRVLRTRVVGAGRWRFGELGFYHVAFPLASLLLIAGGGALLRRFQHTPVLEFAQVLLVAFAIIRTAVYTLRSVFPNGAVLKSFERLITYLIWLGVVLHLTGLLPEIEASLDSVAIPLGKSRLTLLQVLHGIVAVAITLTLAMWLSKLLESRLLNAESVELSLRVILAKLTRAVAIVVAILVALPLVGIDITALSVFGGALGVGLGLGLQKIASSYVSGFIILLDRSIRIGDLVAFENRQGVVTGIYARYTVIKSLDGTEAIVPNDVLVANTVSNLSFTEKRTLVKIPLSVGYDTDLPPALAILVAAAKKHPRALEDPAPTAAISRLGDNGIEIDLNLWIGDADQGQALLRSEIYLDIISGFRTAGIEIPFPKRDIRILQDPAASV